MNSESAEQPQGKLAGLRSGDLGARVKMIAAFAAVYIIWGSTYLAIRIAIQTMPPFAMAGTRFVIAGGILYGWTALRRTPRPKLIHWRSALIIGGLLLVGGNGGVTWAEQEVPSSLAALVVSSTPIWIVLFDALRPGGVHPGRKTMAGIAFGFVGMILLIGPAVLSSGMDIPTISLAVLIMAPVTWALGSLYSRHAVLPRSPLQINGMEMLAGGALLLLAATLSGEWSEVQLSAISPQSAAAFAYLVVFGSIIGFTAYIWLLRHTTPAKATTYAYINPVIAVFLGWAVASEPITPLMLVAMAIILFGVVLITRPTARPAPVPEEPTAPA